MDPKPYSNYEAPILWERAVAFEVSELNPRVVTFLPRDSPSFRDPN